MNLMPLQLGEILHSLIVMSNFLLLIFYVRMNKQFNFFILLRKFISIDQLMYNQSQVLRPNLDKNKLATY
jgi:hypothetical protein